MHLPSHRHRDQRRAGSALRRSPEWRLLDGWLVDTSDATSTPVIEEAGITARAVPLLMTDLDATAAMAAETLTHFRLRSTH